MTTTTDKIDNKSIKYELKSILMDAVLHGLAALLRTAGRRLKGLGKNQEPVCENESVDNYEESEDE